MRVVLNHKEVDYWDIGEKLRILSCKIPSLAYRRPTWVKCLSCGESREFSNPMTAVDFIERHRRKGCKEILIMVSHFISKF